MKKPTSKTSRTTRSKSSPKIQKIPPYAHPVVDRLSVVDALHDLAYRLDALADLIYVVTEGIVDGEPAWTARKALESIRYSVGGIGHDARNAGDILHKSGRLPNLECGLDLDPDHARNLSELNHRSGLELMAELDAAIEQQAKVVRHD